MSDCVLSPTESLTTDQQRSAFQVPFGLAANYTLYDGKHFEPYVGLKAEFDKINKNEVTVEPEKEENV